MRIHVFLYFTDVPSLRQGVGFGIPFVSRTKTVEFEVFNILRL